MSRKQTKRKVWPLIDAVRHGMQGACITDKPVLDKLRLVELAAIEAFAKGHAERNDLRVLADMLNVSETMALNGIGPEALEPNQRAQEALFEVYNKGRLLFTGPQLQLMREAYEYTDLQRTSISRSQFETQIRKTWARIKASTATKVSI